MGLAFAPNSRCIHETKLASFKLHHLVNCIARSPRDRRNNRSRRPRQRIQQSRLAHIRSSDNRNRSLMLLKLPMRAMNLPMSLILFPRSNRTAFRNLVFLSDFILSFLVVLIFTFGLLFLARRNRLGNRVKQFADPQPVLRTQGKHVAKSQLAEVLRRVSHRLALDLVYGQKNWLVSMQQEAHQIVVRAGQLGSCIHHQYKGLRVFQSHLGLVVNLRWNELRIVGHNPARIDQAEPPPPPLELPIDAVTRDSGFVAHNGPPALRQPVEKRGLAHVGPPHNGDQRKSFRSRAGGYNRSAISGQEISKLCEHLYQSTVSAAKAQTHQPPAALSSRSIVTFAVREGPVLEELTMME